MKIDSRYDEDNRQHVVTTISGDQQIVSRYTVDEDMTVNEVNHQQAESGAMRENLEEVYDLFPFEETVASYMRVSEFGVIKYDPWNWSKGLPLVQLLASLMRHSWKLLRGEDHDKETGLHHADHILWNAIAIVHNIYHGNEDGRRKEPAYCETQCASNNKSQLKKSSISNATKPENEELKLTESAERSKKGSSKDGYAPWLT